MLEHVLDDFAIYSFIHSDELQELSRLVRLVTEAMLMTPSR
jgi:hypothetical protein